MSRVSPSFSHSFLNRRTICSTDSFARTFTLIMHVESSRQKVKSPQPGTPLRRRRKLGSSIISAGRNDASPYGSRRLGLGRAVTHCHDSVYDRLRPTTLTAVGRGNSDRARPRKSRQLRDRVITRTVPSGALPDAIATEPVPR